MNELDMRTEEILQPLTGELVPVGDLPKVAEALSELREYRAKLNDAISAFTEAAVAESRRQGTKTLTGAGWTIEVSAEKEIDWDYDELEKLIDAGLPQERYEQLVQPTVTYKVNGSVARSIEHASEVYAEIIKRARRFVPKKQYVRVRGS